LQCAKFVDRSEPIVRGTVCGDVGRERAAADIRPRTPRREMRRNAIESTDGVN
jgi:hypothetical protein